MGTYKSVGSDKYEPSLFNIVLIKPGVGSAAGEIVQCEQAKWFQTSLVLHHAGSSENGEEEHILPQGKYIVLLIAKWNAIAMENTDFK